MAGVDKVDLGNDSDCEDKTVKRLIFKNSNGVTGYLTSNIRQAITHLR